MRKPPFLLFVLILIPVSIALAQSPFSLGARAEKGLQHSDLPLLLDAAKDLPVGADEVSLAVSAAGKTGDSFWAPHLKPFLKYARNRNAGLAALADTTQLALAKVGEHDQMQQIACEAEFGSPSLQDRVVNWKLKYIGGWYSVTLLGSWLDEDHVFSQILFDKHGDVIYMRPQDLALKTLPEIVPNPPPYSSNPNLDDWISQNDDSKLKPMRRAWREWIHENEPALRRQGPVDDGVDLSENTCKQVLARDKHFDRSLLQ